MRKLMAIVVLLCGTASAYAAKPGDWCSDGFDKPAVLKSLKGPGSTWLLTIKGRKPEVIDIESGEIRFATVAADDLDMLPEQDVMIVRDRVFWPCPTKTGTPPSSSP